VSLVRLRRVAQALAVVGVAVLAGVLGWRLTHQAHPPAVGGPAPTFSLPRLVGHDRVSLASLRGKTVVLNFWASWCDPCKREAATLEQISRTYRSRGVVVLGVDTGDDVRSDAQRFVRAHGITYPVLWDANALVAGNRYGVANLPVTYVVDPRGRLVGTRVLGPINEKSFNDAFLRNLDAAIRS